MSKLAALAPLRDLLVDLYPVRESTYQVVDAAGLERGPIAFDNAALTNWQNILVEAHRRGKVRALVEVVQGQYEERGAALGQALEAYEGAPETAEDQLPPEGRSPWLYGLLGAAAVALAAVLYVALGSGSGAEAEVEVLCLVPNASLIMEFMEEDRYSVELRQAPEASPLAREKAPEGILCFLAEDAGAEAESEARKALEEGLARGCLELENGEVEEVLKEYWLEGLEFSRLAAKTIPDELYLKIDDNDGALAEKTVQPRTTSAPRIRILCLLQDLDPKP